MNWSIVAALQNLSYTGYHQEILVHYQYQSRHCYMPFHLYRAMLITKVKRKCNIRGRNNWFFIRSVHGTGWTWSSKWTHATYFCQLTFSICISQLLADYSGISGIPAVITHCPPLVIDAHLHSTLILVGASHQTNITIGTDTSGIDYRKKLLWWQYAKDSAGTINTK